MAPQSFRLVMRSGPTPGKAFDLSKNEISIGRDVSNDIIINDAEISRRHARLTAQPGGYVLEDNGSTNGTFVNGQRLMGPHLLRPGELVLFGENVGMAFEPVEPDIDATQVAGQPIPPVPPTVPQGSYPPSPQQPAYPPTQQAYPPTPPAYPVQQAYPGGPVYPPQPAYNPPPAYQPQPVSPPPYVGAIPGGPEEMYPAGAETLVKDNRTRNWILAGCGCLIILLCACVVGAFVFDRANLYCTNSLTSFFTNAFSSILNAIFGTNYGCPV
jgi:hypothetical protein